MVPALPPSLPPSHLQKERIEQLINNFNYLKLFIQKCPLKKILKYSENWKLEKTLFERHQNKNCTGLDLGFPADNRSYTVTLKKWAEYPFMFLPASIVLNILIWCHFWFSYLTYYIVILA